MAAKFAKSVAFAKETLGKTVLVPSASKFSDIFESVDAGKKIVAVMTADKDRMKISNWVRVGKAHKVRGEYPSSFHATPKKSVLEAMDKSMIVVKYDEIYFEITVRSAGEALVTAKHNQILGDRWLGFIDPKTIPTGIG